MGEKLTVKGTHIAMGRSWINERLGEGSFEELAAGVGARWSAPILPSSWYEVLPFFEIIKQAAKKAGVPVIDAVTEIATRNAQKDLTTVYRAFLRVAGPKALLRATPILWRNYVAFAVTKKITNDQGLLIAECRMMPAALLDWAQGCWHGFAPAAIELAGGRNVKSLIVDGGEEAEHPGYEWFRFEITYEG